MIVMNEVVCVGLIVLKFVIRLSVRNMVIFSVGLSGVLERLKCLVVSVIVIMMVKMVFVGVGLMCMMVNSRKLSVIVVL